jgi:metallo-beta-lactamase family protein
VLYSLNQLHLEKRLPEIPCFVDSPLSLKATATIKQFTDNFNERLQQVLKVDDDPFHFPGLNYIESVEDSRKLTSLEEPCVIISASGTADAGRVRHHINSCIGNAKNAVLFVGYCGSGSLGGQLIGGSKEIEIFSDTCTVAATVGQMGGLSAHGDTDDLTRFLGDQDPEKVKSIYLVHGEYKVQQEFSSRLERKGFKNIQIPALHESVDLTRKPQSKESKRARIKLNTP